MVRRYTSKTKQNAPEDLTREHSSLSGFEWSCKLPERSSAPLGSYKPRAQILCEGYEPYHIPVAVAKKLEQQIKKGECQEPESHAELLYLIRTASDKLALQRVADMVSRREYSSYEAAQRLERDGYSKACAERCVERAQELGIIDNKRFADSFIRSKVYMGWGPLRIERELSSKGIDPSAVGSWPEDYLGSESLTEAATELLRTKRIPEKNAYEKLVRFLVTRGYPLGVAKACVCSRLDECED